MNLDDDSSSGQLWQMAINRPNAKYEVDPAGYQIVGTFTIDTSSGQKLHANRTGYFEPYVL